ncbi:U11/U12 small nuclear ribonucleoprotein 35 kDa protein-like [Watersipora subatra]|uniref:U11/U12 small nuclear ribonucleoprotein 35 kDa protein-like n=1 Tax=Watersipora subatra TaxID=2589382 RepID=UPI00355B1C45
MTDSIENWTPIAEKYHPLTCGSIDGTDDYPHDKAVLRALNSSYKPNKQVEGDPLCTIFVGRLNPDTIEEALHQVFSEYGSIKHIRLVRDIISGFSKRYAFIEYKSGTAARKAAARANKMVLDDRELLVDMECERELEGWIPRRLGGGFGGKKESGQLRFGGKDRPFRKPIILNRYAHVGASQHLKTDVVVSSRNYSQGREHDQRDRQTSRHSREESEHRTRSYSSYRGNRDDSHDSRRHYSRDKRERSRTPTSRSKTKKHSRDHRSRSRDRAHKRSRHE